jgi:hypothetical protein
MKILASNNWNMTECHSHFQDACCLVVQSNKNHVENLDSVAILQHCPETTADSILKNEMARFPLSTTQKMLS